MPKTHIIAILLILSSIGAKAQSSTEKSVIYEGKGVDSLKLGTLTAHDVKVALGDDFQAANHDNYSIQIFYPQLGMAFYRKYGLDTGKVFCMAFREPYEGSTAMGFKMSTMTVQNMLRIYGKAEWFYVKEDNMVYANYAVYGIYFSIKPHGAPPAQFNADKINQALQKARNDYFMNTYYNDKVMEITIGVPGTDF